ncbi:MAG: glycosyltransferase [Phycisphaerae bacterium]|nr:glycosyltransferase [Phycisphaerae bacterium]
MAGVLHIIDAETATDALRQLAAVVAPDDQVVSVGPVDVPREFTVPVQRIHRPLGSAAVEGLAARAPVGQVQLVQAWSVAAAQAGEAIARRKGCEMVVHLPHFPPLRRLDCLAVLASWGNVAVTVPTEACRGRLVAEGLSASIVHVLPPASAAIQDRPALRTRTRRALGVSDEHHLMVAPGALTQQAGHKYACWVFAVLREIRSDVRLLVPGEGPARPSVQYFASTLGYDREIHMPAGRIGLADALAAADVVVSLPTGDDPGVSLAAALVAGLPVVAWATADVQELTGGSRAAALSPVGDVRGASAESLRLLDEPAAAGALASAAAAWAGPRYSVAAAGAALERIRSTLHQGAWA